MTEENTPMPYIDKTAPDEPPTAILSFTRMELEIFRAMADDWEKGHPMAGGITRIYRRPGLVLAGPILGAPMAGMVLELLRMQKITTFLSLGWCGSLQPSLRWGDIVMPMSAFSEEGTSAHYPCDGGPACADPDLVDRLAAGLNEKGYEFSPGRVWTTDAPFRETRDKIEAYAAEGMLAVDMETSAVLAVSAFHQLSWAGLMVVSDHVWSEKWEPGFASQELKDGLHKAAEVVMQATS